MDGLPIGLAGASYTAPLAANAPAPERGWPWNGLRPCLYSRREAGRRHRPQRRRRGSRRRAPRQGVPGNQAPQLGGFLKQSNATIILGVEDDSIDAVLEIVRDTCHARTQIVNPMPPIMEPGEFFMPYPLEVEVGGATVFVLPVERFERL